MSERYRKEKNWLEWFVFGIGLVLVISIVGYLAYHAITAPTGPAQIEIALGRPRAQGGEFAVPVTVMNRGHETAEHVHIQVTLTTSSGKEERAQFEVQFLPRGATREGSVTFQSNPAEARELKPRVLGYQRP